MGLLPNRRMQPMSLGVARPARGRRFASAAHPAPPLTLAADALSVRLLKASYSFITQIVRNMFHLIVSVAEIENTIYK